MTKQKDKQRYVTKQIVWEGFDIDVRYCCQWLQSSGMDLVHLEIMSADRRRLPLTETGYKSHFTSRATIDDAGGAVAFVLAWLAETSQSQAWQRHREEQAQACLF